MNVIEIVENKKLHLHKEKSFMVRVKTNAVHVERKVTIATKARINLKLRRIQNRKKKRQSRKLTLKTKVVI